MTTEQGSLQGSLTRVRESVTAKVFVIALIIFALMIPAAMVRSLIHEREWRQASVVNELGSKWGGSQTLTGPILSLPFERAIPGPDGKPVTVTLHLHVLPDQLDVTGQVIPEVRYRGIYEAVLYNARLKFSGSFSMPDLQTLGISPKSVRWERAFVALGIPDMKGLRSGIRMNLAGNELEMNPGIASADVLASGLSCTAPDLRRVEAMPFDLSLDLNGSQWLGFVPAGKTTTVQLESAWTSPSFDGAFLPEARSVADKGFNATWKVLHLNRNYPQAWTGSQYAIGDSAFGVKLFIPVDAYQKSTRTVKYALLFIVSTFTAFFVCEMMKRVRVHPLQYLLVGLALIVFYALLLSISEHLSFDKGYLISSAATILLIAGYARSVLQRGALALAVGMVLATLYGYLYLLLQVEDYTLLLGSVGLFVLLGIVMFLTRRINWYAAGQQPSPPTLPAGREG